MCRNERTNHTRRELLKEMSGLTASRAQKGSHLSSFEGGGKTGERREERERRERERERERELEAELLTGV